ncbi:MAG TPA: UDP-N-acetylmuramoyl-L-alanyl-D-glutamate--2,6-diaminopimelate ligase [candidate division Zixibacteria bacterium]|nr:UDP-N-acetylmuramoyl-L-alanyl-D-glutamate--2,6-diaminopimelate ligase [candidate division Zixibacteria bacterium]
MKELIVTLRELTEGLEGAVITGDAETPVEHIEYDSRMVKPRSLFVAVSGFKRDGYDFVPDAVARGAVAVLGEKTKCDHVANHVQVPDARRALADVAARFYKYPGHKMKVCGVTGTNGKTTTCYLVRNILQTRGKRVGLLSSVLYDTGEQTFTAQRTTPESLDAQRLLFLMHQNQCVNAVVEVSSHALVLHRVDNIDFRVAVYTNLTRDHLDFHKTMEEYLAAKKLLLDRLTGDNSYAVINLDVPEFRALFADLKTAHISYSLEDRAADVYCASYEISPQGTLFDLVTPMGTQTVRFPLPGRFNLINAMAAAAAGLACGIDLDNVVKGLETAGPVPGRLEPVVGGQPFGVYVDFAHTPDALIRLCETAREMTGKRLLLLFGCGGDRDSGKRALMGEAATTAADYVVVTADNPRSENIEKIIEDIRPGLKGKSYEIILDRKDAIAALIARAQEGDVVLLAGKGAEDYQEVDGVRHPHSDRKEALKTLASLGYTISEADEES